MAKMIRLFGKKSGSGQSEKRSGKADGNDVANTITPEGRRILERMLRLSGDNMTVDELSAFASSHIGYTREEADKAIRDLEKGPFICSYENDDGPVHYTKEDIIRQIEAAVIES